MTLTASLVSQLRRDIVRGLNKPGQRLREKDLCKRYGVSRTPVREALKQLEKENLVKINPNAGASVVDLSIKDISDIYDVLIVLETAVTSLASIHASSEGIRRLEEYQFKMEKAAGQGNNDLVFELNLQFHLLINTLANNHYLAEIRENYRNLVDRFARFAAVIPGQVEATLEEHQRIIEAIKLHNPAMGEFVMNEHMMHSKKLLLGYIRDLYEKRDTSIEGNSKKVKRLRNDTITL